MQDDASDMLLFLLNYEKWLKLGQKTYILVYFEMFLVYFLLLPKSYAPRFCQIKDLIKIHVLGKFHQYSICGCEVKNFQSFSYVFSIDEIAPFWGGQDFSHLFPEIMSNLAKILTRGIRTNTTEFLRLRQRVIRKGLP